MPQSLIKVLIHIVFSTKGRANLITPDIEQRLYSYISGIIEKNGAKLIIANGTMNHSHFLISLGRTELAILIGDIKRGSSAWIKKLSPEYANFYCQKGYGAFSVGQSQVEDVSRYIGRQKEHHDRHTYEDEYRELCRKYGVDMDERYCWD